MAEKEETSGEPLDFCVLSAQRVPFFLRAWWLRDYQETADLTFAEAGAVTGGIWAMYADPLCDLSNWDDPEG
jgi:hypothetical protein